MEAVPRILEAKPDVLFLDIEMPGMTGFEMLAQLQPQPWVVFTTAYDRYALEAFGVNSVDYLLKPIEAAQLDRALDKIERMRGTAATPPAMAELIRRLTRAVISGPRRFQSWRKNRVHRPRSGDAFLRLRQTDVRCHARPRITRWITPIQELEQKLDPARFVRVHRATLVNVAHVQELHSWFAGRMMVRLKDPKHTEITVSRDRVRALKQRLGI